MDRRDRKLFRNAYANIIELREGLTTKRGFLTRYEMVSDLLQSYGIVAFFDPVFAVERRLDVEIWDIVCKDTLQKCISSVSKRACVLSVYFASIFAFLDLVLVYG